MSRAVVVMGPSGSGKTTVGKALARSLGWKFVEGDDFHSAANRAKMAAGTPLTDADRAPWLKALAAEMVAREKKEEDIVLACSALKKSYRDTLRVHDDVSFVYLDVPVDVLEKRLHNRHGHFIAPSLLPSQLATLELPADAITVNGAQPVGQVIEDIADKI